MDELYNLKGWIYICMNITNPNECKIGMTRRALFERIVETGNPDYRIVKAYKVPPEEALKLERHLQREVGKWYERKSHFITGKKSEWFLCSPAEAAQAMEHDLAKCLCLQDEDGNPKLDSIIFKPIFGLTADLVIAERIRDEQHYYNLMKAIR
jgi:hypothetical protein